jgi:SM-20-related protein
MLLSSLKYAPWELHVKRPKSTGEVEIITHEDALKLTEKEKLKLVPKVLTLKDKDLSFIYSRYTIPTPEDAASENLLILTRVTRYFNSKDYLQLMGEITGDCEGREVSLWASRYDPNHHLSVHADENLTQGRIAAHVLGLTKNWKKEWGGQFAFCDARGKPVSYHPPKFNQLTLFKVPRLHLVTRIKPYAKESRYSLFG